MAIDSMKKYNRCVFGFWLTYTRFFWIENELTKLHLLCNLLEQQIIVSNEMNAFLYRAYFALQNIFSYSYIFYCMMISFCENWVKKSFFMRSRCTKLEKVSLSIFLFFIYYERACKNMEKYKKVYFWNYLWWFNYKKKKKKRKNDELKWATALFMNNLS